MPKTVPRDSVPNKSDSEAERWQREFEADRTRVLKASKVSTLVDELVSYGAERDRLLSLLVLSRPAEKPERLRARLRERANSGSRYRDAS